MMLLPTKIPAEPTPEIALPTIRVVEFGEMAQMKEHTLNMQIEERQA